MTEKLEIEEKKSQDIAQRLSDDISSSRKADQEKGQHMDIIKLQLADILKMDIISIEENSSSGANTGFLAIASNNTRYYVKTFDEEFKRLSGSTKKIDARELLAYKVLEYLGFGPETHFLIQKDTSTSGSKAKGNYIATKDVTTLDKNVESQRRFFIDGSGDINSREVYQKAVESKNFLVELFSIVSLNSILRLYDTFGDNSANYGIIEIKMKDGSIEYEPIIIDHLPSTSNAIIEKGYSPGGFLYKRLYPKIERASDQESNLRRVIKEQLSSKSMKLTKEVRSMVDQGKKGKSFKNSVQEGCEQIMNLIEEYGNVFVDATDPTTGKVIPSRHLLEVHGKVIMENYNNFMATYL